MTNNMNGKITIKSGKYKAIITIMQDNYLRDEQKVNISFEPELDLKINSPEINFVANFTQTIIRLLKGEDQ